MLFALCDSPSAAAYVALYLVVPLILVLFYPLLYRTTQVLCHLYKYIKYLPQIDTVETIVLHKAKRYYRI